MKNQIARALLLSLLPATACSHEVRTDRQAVEDSVDLRIASADRVQAGPLAPITTVLYSERDAEVRARIDGVVAALSAELGDQAAAGRLLGRLQDDKELAAVEAATAAAELARAAHARAVKLHGENVLTQAELDDAVYRVRTAEAALRDANARLEYTRIRAPFAGAVSRRFVRIGQAVNEGEPLFRVTALRPLRAQVRIPEKESHAVASGQSVRLRGPNGEEVQGIVYRISPAVDPVSGTVEVLVDVPEPAGLRPGSAVTVDLRAGPPSETGARSD